MNEEKLKDIKGIIRSRSSNDRQYNGQIKRTKGQQRSTKHYTENYR